MDSYTISLSLYSLEGFNTQLTSVNLSTQLNNGSNTTQGQDESQGCTKEYVNKDLMHQEKNESFNGKNKQVNK